MSDEITFLPREAVVDVIMEVIISREQWLDASGGPMQLEIHEVLRAVRDKLVAKHSDSVGGLKQQQWILDVLWSLFSQGVLIPGRDFLTPCLPYFHRAVRKVEI